jgi:hypothetical protein
VGVTVGGVDDRAAELERLEDDARYARERLALYRAKAQTGHETSPVRMRELQRSADQTAERLNAARRRARRRAAVDGPIADRS